MKIEVKLYSYHDMDLVGLYKTGKISFPETTRQILNSYANKEVYKVKVLKTNEERLAKYPKDSFRKYYHYHVMLDKKSDADAIALLKKITPGYRNNFIKVVLRQYLCGVFLPEYFVDGDSGFFNEMSRRFQGDRDEKEIHQIKRGNNSGAKKKKMHVDALMSNNESVKSKPDGDSSKSGKVSKLAAAFSPDNNESNAVQNNDRNGNSVSLTENSQINLPADKRTGMKFSKTGSASPDKQTAMGNSDSQNAFNNSKSDNQQEIGSPSAMSELQKDLTISNSHGLSDFKDTDSNETSEGADEYMGDFDDFLDGTTEQY